MRIIAPFVFILISYMSSMAQQTFHDFIVQDIDGNEISLSDFKGKKVLVVNVASKCGYTPQYKELQELYEAYGGDNFTIVAFPANNFLRQEPGTYEEIKQFCTSKYDVSFPIMSKISVKGKDQAPVYTWLTKSDENGVMDAKVSWNFQKFLISEDGQWLTYFSPKVSPMSDEIIDWLK